MTETTDARRAAANLMYALYQQQDALLCQLGTAKTQAEIDGLMRLLDELDISIEKATKEAQG